MSTACLSFLSSYSLHQEQHCDASVCQHQWLFTASSADSTYARLSPTLQVYIGNLVGGLVTEEALRQLFNNTMAAAFPDQVRIGLLDCLRPLTSPLCLTSHDGPA